MTGALLVLIPMTGEYIIPNILGGGNFEFVGNVIGDQFNVAQNQPFGSALAISPDDRAVHPRGRLHLLRRQGGAVRCVRILTAKIGFTVWAWIVFGFLYLPILVMVVFAFNKPSAAAGPEPPRTDVAKLSPDQVGNVAVWNGFTPGWFSAGLHDPTYIPAIVTSLEIALVAAVIATVLGSGAALALARMKRLWRAPFDVLVYLTLVVPEIVIAVASLIFFVQARNYVRAFPTLGQGDHPPRSDRVQRVAVDADHPRPVRGDG